MLTVCFPLVSFHPPAPLGLTPNFRRAIDFTSSTELSIDRMRITGNTFGVSTNEGAIVRDNVVARNGRGSISHDGLNIGARSVVTGNISNFNTGNGIVVGNASIIVGNTTSLNGNNGLDNTSLNNGTNFLFQGESCSDVNNIVDP